MKKHIGRHLQILRDELGINQDEMALKIGKSKSLVSYIERTGKVSDATLMDLAKVLKVSFESLKAYPLTEADNRAGEIEALKKENQERLKEIELLRKVIEGQEKLIRILEGKG